ncbi:MAG: hypothetical protein JST89_25405 [Cyanobacteria bacterium SZAS-4]|nr:hypothetical protein [Cyanobacteria bacterium SZAS-4]
MSAHHETQIYSPRSAAVEGDRINSTKHSASNNGLHSEAINHLSGPKAKTSTEKGSDSEKLKVTNGDYWVVRGDNLYKIAQKSLVAQGKDRPDGRSIYAEIDRIVELNLKYYPKLKDHRLEPGMILTVENKNQPAKAKPVSEASQPAAAAKSNDPNSPCTDQTWKFAEPGTVTTAQKCDLVFAPADSKVVVHPGGQALLQRGSSGFIFKGGRATVEEGATVLDAGGTIELKTGARYVDMQELTKQAQMARQAQADAEARAQLQASESQALAQKQASLKQQDIPRQI